MTPELELLFETQITNVSKNMSSIFSKEDVVIMLKTLRHYIDELPEVVPAPAVGYTKNQIIDAVKDMFENYDFDQYLEYEPELHGSYGGSYSLEINARFDETQFTRDFLCELPDYFETNNEE
jgi:hypothetical protein